MSVRLTPYEGNRWMVDVRVRLASGKTFRERRVISPRSKTAAKRWAENRERHLLQHGPAEQPKEVATLEAFAPRFVNGHAKANRLKPSTIASIEAILKWHLLPAFGSLRLNAVTAEQVQRLKLSMANKSPKTINNCVGLLSAILKKAVEWGELDAMPCAIKPLKNPKREMAFYTHDELARVIASAQKRGREAHLMVLLGADAGLRLGEIVALQWSDIDLTARRLSVQRADWLGQVGSPKGGRVRRLPLTRRLVEALKAHRHLRSERVFCLEDGAPTTRDRVIKAVRASERAAGVTHAGIHILRHTFCSHLAMANAPARSIQELAGHASISTTQRYMHLSPSATEDAIRLLERPAGYSAGQYEGNESEAACN